MWTIWGGGGICSYVVTIFLAWDLDVTHGPFILTMKLNSTQTMVEVVAFIANKVNPIIVNHFICLWRLIHVSQFLFHSFPKYLKLTKIATIHVFSSIEDERCFILVSFLENKTCNQLNFHLQLVIAMYACFFPHLIFSPMRLLILCS
jgi:hypothetical protein